MEKQSRSSAKIGNILKISEISLVDVGIAGSKAATLGELARIGIRVPDGFVLTVDAFDQFLDDNNISIKTSINVVAAAEIPPTIIDAILAAAAELGDVSLAVRSSGVAEDLPDASFAGQYETVLDVYGKDALLDAVRRCWSSAFNERVVAYRKAQGQRGVPRMAVLVQHMVVADAAGVAFTANPVTGERDTVVIDAVRGLGERLVSGKASPDEWLVKGNDVTCQSTSENSINTLQALTVARLARRVETQFGCPQDIEWAYAGGNLFLLQARPITTLPKPLPEGTPAPVEPPPGSWWRDAHVSEPIRPLTRSLHIHPFNVGLKQLCDELGWLVETIQYRDIGGWLYVSVVPLSGKEGSTPPSLLLAILARLNPLMRSKIKKCIEAVRADIPGQIIRLWYEVWKPSQLARIAELRRVDLQSLSDVALEEYLNELASFFMQSMSYHAKLFAHSVPLAKLAFTCRELLGWDDAQTMELLSGISEKSSEPSRRLNDLARMATERPLVRAFLETSDNPDTDRLDKVDAEFADAFNAYKNEFCCRTLKYNFHEKTLTEKPELIISLLRDQIARCYDTGAVEALIDEKRAAALDKARRDLANHPASHRERFERSLASAEVAYPVREDNAFYNNNVPFALVRYGLLELGSRLCGRGQMTARDDVFFLDLSEATAALLGQRSIQELVARRKAENTWAERHPGPATYGRDPGPLPSFTGFPSEVKFMMKALLWWGDLAVGISKGQEQSGKSKKLNGIGASSGRYTGPVRVIMDESDFGKIQAGDVLVCPMTSPAWSLVFPSIGAIITDTGGVLSHPAIIAREFGVPAIVATGSATSRLQDGQIVTVDGSNGVIELNA